MHQLTVRAGVQREIPVRLERGRPVQDVLPHVALGIAQEQPQLGRRLHLCQSPDDQRMVRRKEAVMRVRLDRPSGVGAGDRRGDAFMGGGLGGTREQPVCRASGMWGDPVSLELFLPAVERK